MATSMDEANNKSPRSFHPGDVAVVEVDDESTTLRKLQQQRDRRRTPATIATLSGSL